MVVHLTFVLPYIILFRVRNLQLSQSDSYGYEHDLR